MSELKVASCFEFEKVLRGKSNKLFYPKSEVDQDHIHLLVRIRPNESISRVAHDLKQQSTYLMWQKHHDYLSKFYWSGQHHLWTRGYFASTIGGVSEKTLVEYITNQG